MTAEITPIKKKVNPDIKTVDIGVRDLRTITLYPLSAKDQIELSNKLVTVLSSMGESLNDETTNEQALSFFQKVITENLEVILAYVVDENEMPKMDELTNNQLYVISNTIFEVNYEGFLKNFMGLYGRAKKILG